MSNHALPSKISHAEDPYVSMMVVERPCQVEYVVFQNHSPRMSKLDFLGPPRGHVEKSVLSQFHEQFFLCAGEFLWTPSVQALLHPT